MYGSGVIPHSDKPYVPVACKLYDCQYGKQRHNSAIVSLCSIGCLWQLACCVTTAKFMHSLFHPFPDKAQLLDIFC